MRGKPHATAFRERRGEAEAYLRHGGGLFVRLGFGSRLSGKDLVYRGKRVDALEEFLSARANGGGDGERLFRCVLGSFSRNRTGERNFASFARWLRPGKRTAPSRRTWRRNRTPPPSAMRQSAPLRARASPSSASSERERGVSLRARGWGNCARRRVNNERKSLA